MTSISELLFQAFPTHTVSVRHRPDGTLAVTIGEGDQVVSRVIPREAVLSEQKIYQTIRDIQRDMKIAAGELRVSGPDARWVWSALPTYDNGPIHVTRAKRLSQRPICQKRPRFQSVHLSA